MVDRSLSITTDFSVELTVEMEYNYTDRSGYATINVVLGITTTAGCAEEAVAFAKEALLERYMKNLPNAYRLTKINVEPA